MKPTAALTLLTTGFLGFCQVVHGAAYTFTTIDAPYQGVFRTFAHGINDSGEISGSYWTTNASTGLISHGFLLNNGTFSTYDFMSSGTSFSAINNQGQVVGSSGNVGFLFSNGQFSTITVPGAIKTFANGINNTGQIVGEADTSTIVESFLLSGGNYSFFNPGGFVLGINDVGQIVGTAGAMGYLLSNGIESLITFPATCLVSSSLNGINDHGTIVGAYSGGCIVGVRGLILGPNGVFSTLEVPGSTLTILSGINNEGDIVGTYTDSNDVVHGFLATPNPIPEPSSLMLLASGLAGIIILILRMRITRTSRTERR
jgi:uncharacterized membrane protein